MTEKLEMKDMREELKKWEASNQKHLMNMIRVIREIRENRQDREEVYSISVRWSTV